MTKGKAEAPEHEEREHSKRATAVKLTEYKYGSTEDQDGIHSSLNELVNGKKAKVQPREKDIAGDRCTVIISTPEKWGGSFGGHPGHCGIALWNSETFQYQSFGILSDGTFADEEVNVHNDTIKEDKNFRIWYFTVKIDKATYGKLRARMSKLGTKKVEYGKFLVYRGWKEDASYSCVTAVDTILVAGGLSKAIASLTSAPYSYAQTFTTLGWYCNYAEDRKHM